MNMITNFEIFESYRTIPPDNMMEILKKHLNEYEFEFKSFGISIYDPCFLDQIYNKTNYCQTKNVDVKKIQSFIKPFGWYISSVVGDQDIKSSKTIEFTQKVLSGEDKSKILIVNIEKEFGELVNKKPMILYHITDEKYLPKIKEKGLIPKFNGKRTIHPERVYLCSKDGISWLLKDFNHILEKPVIIAVTDLSKIKLYYDDNFIEGGFYTTDNIPPKDISFNISM